MSFRAEFLEYVSVFHKHEKLILNFGYFALQEQSGLKIV